MKGWNQRKHVYQPNIRLALTIYRTFHWPKDESSQIIDQTNRSSTPTKTEEVFQPLQVLPNALDERGDKLYQ
jgi:DNA-binding XRE family transcriptional regulator